LNGEKHFLLFLNSGKMNNYDDSHAKENLTVLSSDGKVSWSGFFLKIFNLLKDSAEKDIVNKPNC